MNELSDDQVSEFKEAFTFFDVDGDGAINKEDLRTVMRKLGFKPTNEELDQMIKDGAASNSDKLDFTEFLSMFAARMKGTDPEDEIKEAFRAFDLLGDGFIPSTDLKAHLTTLGDKLTPKEAEELVREADPESKGRIDYNYFVGQMTARR